VPVAREVGSAAQPTADNDASEAARVTVTVEDAVHWTGNICLAVATLGCLYVVMAGFLVLRFKSRDAKAVAKPVPVTILVPLCGFESRTYAQVRALCEQNYDAPVQIVCGSRSLDDPAIQVAKRVAEDLPDQKLDLHVDGHAHGSNLKISNLMNMESRARHDTLVLIDSDIEVDPDYLSSVIGELQAPNVGAVTCLHRGVSYEGIWARLAALGANTHFLPNVIVALTFGLARPCFGATIAISRETLQRIGGFAAFADQLWDDYAIGQAVRRIGYEVAIPPFALSHVYSDRSLRELVVNQLRYGRTIRSINPAGFVGGIITQPFAAALLAALLGAGQRAVEIGIFALAGRFVLCWCVEQRFGVRSGSYWLIPVRDIMAFAVYVASFFGARVTWRGQRYRVSNGTLVPDPVE
jgi:ceramide glucosyltransferase